MPGYQTAVADLMRQRRDSGLEDVPLNVLILGRAVDAALPGIIEARNGFFYMGSVRIETPSDLNGTINIPGVRFRHLLMVGDQDGLVMTDDPPAVVLVPFGIGGISSLIGAENIAIIAGLSKIWKERIGPSGLLPPESVKAALALLSIGIIVTPETAEQLTAAFPRLPLALRNIPNATPERRAAWYEIAERMRADLAAYYRKQVAVAAAAVDAAAADVAFWDKIYKAVEAVRDLPATAAGAALGVAGAAVSSAWGVFARGPFFLLAGLGVAAAAVWWFWPMLAGKAVKLAKGARDG